MKTSFLSTSTQIFNFAPHKLFSTKKYALRHKEEKNGEKENISLDNSSRDARNLLYGYNRSGRHIVEKLDKTEPDVRVYDSSDSDDDDFYRVNVYDDVLAGDHFYPTEDDPDGKSLFIEFSLLWNETLANSSKGWAEFARFHAKDKTTSYDSAFWFALKDGFSSTWCKEAGGFEYGTGENGTTLIANTYYEVKN